VTQDGRFVDLGANTDPQRHYQTRRYTDVRALQSTNQSINKKTREVGGKRTHAQTDGQVKNIGGL